MRPVEVRQHDDGTWYTRLYQGTDPVTGRKIRKYKRFPEASDEEEALELARDWAASLPAGGAEPARLVDVLNRYVAALPGMGVSTNTVRSYAADLRNYIAPIVGNVDVDELRPRHVEAMYSALLARGLSPLTVNQVHWFLKGAYKWIVRNDLSPFDPMQSVGHPRAPQREAPALGAEALPALDSELRARMSGARTGKRGGTFARMAATASYLALWTGMRCGECCGLLVGDWRPASSTLRVAGTVVEPPRGAPELQRHTKGRRARNVSVTPGVALRIGEHLEWRAELPSGARPGCRPMLCSASGGLLRPSDVSEWFGKLAREMELPPGTTFHTLRHTHASHLIASGVDMRAVQERLGHADVSTTLRLYAHVLPGRDREAAEAFGRAVGDGGEG